MASKLPLNALTTNWVSDGTGLNKARKLVNGVVGDIGRFINVLKNTSDKQVYLLAYKATQQRYTKEASVLTALETNRLYPELMQELETKDAPQTKDN
jgi:hypothetical protein